MVVEAHFFAPIANSFAKLRGKMIYFIYGEDSYRSKRKLEEIILGYKEKNKSGLSLLYIDAGEMQFKDFYSNLKINSMFAEKKLVVLKNVFRPALKESVSEKDSKFQEEFLDSIKDLENTKDIIVIYEDKAPDKRTKLFKVLQKSNLAGQVKCQEFEKLDFSKVKDWAAKEFLKNKIKINTDALDLLVGFVGNDLWQMANEITKVSNYGQGRVVSKEDVELLVKPNVENDIFKTIDALASKNKKLALSLLHKHLDNGEAPLYLLSMIAYQFRNLLIIKESPRNTGLHPFVVQKSSYLCRQFTMEELKKIYQKIFQIDCDIKTGKIEAETAIDLLLSEV